MYTPSPESRRAVSSHRLEGFARTFMLPPVRRIVEWAGKFAWRPVEGIDAELPQAGESHKYALERK